MTAPSIPRRNLLTAGAALGLAGSLPVWTARAASTRPATLILLELAGGNDALNTLVPYSDPLYRRLRPRLAWPDGRLMALNDDVALPDAVRELAPLWERGDLALLPAVGTPEHDRSHFRAADIWEAGRADAAGERGWLEPLLRTRRDHDVPGIVLGGRSGPLAGCGALHIDDPESFLAEAVRLSRVQVRADSAALRHVVAVHNTTGDQVRSLADKLSRARPLPGRPPRHAFARQLFNAGRLLAAGVDVPVMKLVLPGFDTHANQRGRHERLLRTLARGLARFATALDERGLWQDVAIVCWSEFGRRVRENASGGSDHGGGGLVLLLGGRVRGGLYGEMPSLEQLDQGDLPVRTDYRRVYASLADALFPGAANPFAEQGHRPLAHLLG